MERPRPVPLSPFVVKNGSKIRGMFSAAIPVPVSLTSTTALPALVGPRRDAHLVPVRVPLGDGLRRVDQQVEKHLPEARLVRFDRRHLGKAAASAARDAGSRATPSGSRSRRCHARRRARAARRFPARTSGGRARSAARGSRPRPSLLERPREAVQPFGGAREFADGVVAGARRAKAPEDVLQIDEQIRERIVDLVRHAGRQRPERRHAIALHELLLESTSARSRRGRRR